MDIRGKRILSIDYGLARVGIAMCDELHISIMPLKTIFSPFIPELSEQIAKLVETEHIGVVVLGVPYSEDEEHIMRPHIEKFHNELLDKITLPVYLQDETYSSVQAVQTMVQVGNKKKKRSTKGNIDKIAAAIILRTFLEDNE